MNFVNVSLHAATLPVQDDRSNKQIRQLLENCLKQDEEVQFLTKKVSIFTKLDDNNKEIIAALDAVVDNQAKTIAALKAANKASGGIEVIDAKQLKSLEDSLADAKKQMARLEAKVSFWKKVAAISAPVMIGIGVVIGVAVSK